MAEPVHVHCKPNTARNYGLSFDNHIRPRLGLFKIEDIRRFDIADFHHSMKEIPYQANRALAALSKMFNVAELWGLRPDGSNPCRLVPKFKEKAKERYLTQEDLIRLGQVFADAIGTGSESPLVVAAHTPRQRPQWAESRTKLQSNTISVSQLYAAAFIGYINSSQLFT